MSTVSATTAPGVSLNAQVMMLLTECNSAKGANAKKEVDFNSEKLERLRAEIQRALEEAKAAEEDAGFWGAIADFFGGDLAKVAQVVASAAALVATGGAATPFIVAAIACAGAAEIGKAVGLDPKICMALSVAGAALGLCAGGAGAGPLSQVAAGATAVSGGAQAVGGGASIAEGQYRADVLRANARGQRAEAEQARVQLLFQQILERLQQLQDQDSRATSTGSRIAADSHYGRDAVLMNFHGGSR